MFTRHHSKPFAMIAMWVLGVYFSLFAEVSKAAAETPVMRAAKDKPNIVVLFMDDGGYGDLSCYGHPTIRTPNLDKMATEGTKFTQFYSSSPACSASRYGLLTGRLPVRSGFGWVLMPKSPQGILPEEVTIAEGLKTAGYATACFGKWHLGRPKKYLPLQNGFDEYLGLPYSNDMRPLPLIDGNSIIEEKTDQRLLTERYTRRAQGFIRKNKERPFFCYLPYAMPHTPLNPGKAFQGKSLRGKYGDVIEEIDWSVGEILKTLRDEGLEKNTLVIFTSDNGPWIIKNERGGSAGLLRDGKGSTWEGGMREPCIAYWPGTIPAGKVSHQFATTMDILPTVFHLAGVELPVGRTLDGVDITNALLGKSLTKEHPPLFYYGAGMHLYAVRQGPWKLHVRQYSQTGKKYFKGKVPLLFNVETDPSEKYDLAGKRPIIVTKLQALLETHRTSVVAEKPSKK